MRNYRIAAAALIDAQNPVLDLSVDPKANWALNHLDFFPVEVSTASLE